MYRRKHQNKVDGRPCVRMMSDYRRLFSLEQLRVATSQYSRGVNPLSVSLNIV